jgi:hypothetical protein
MIPKGKGSHKERRNHFILEQQSSKHSKSRGGPNFKIDNLSKAEQIRVAREHRITQMAERIARVQGINDYSVVRDWSEIMADYVKSNRIREDHIDFVIKHRYASWAMPTIGIDEFMGHSGKMQQEYEEIKKLHKELMKEENEAIEFNSALEAL